VSGGSTRTAERLETRSPNDDDAERVAALIADVTRDWLGRPPATTAAVRETWHAPGIRLARDGVVAVAGEDVVGYALAQRTAPTTLWLDLWVRTGELAETAADAVLRALRPRVAALAQQARVDAPVVARVQVDAERTDVRAAVERAGFACVRTSLQSVVEDPAWPSPRWPDGVDVRTFAPSDARALHALAMDALEETWEFTREPFESWVGETQAPSFDPTLWWIAEHRGEPVATLLCRADDVDPQLVWYQLVAVRHDWRGRWLPFALAFHSLQELQARGVRRIGAGFDAENRGGSHLLAARVGFDVKRRFLVYERRVRKPQPMRRALRRARRAMSGGRRP
jgi:GNAT superfamily N-acetyltransferase